MKKTITTLIAIVALSFSSSTVFAASTKCTVSSVDKGTIILDCGSKSSKFSVGQDVKIKSAKKKAIEGC